MQVCQIVSKCVKWTQNSLQSRRHFPKWHTPLETKTRHNNTDTNENTNAQKDKPKIQIYINTHNMCHWIPCHRQQPGDIHLWRHNNILIQLQIQIQIPIWIWIQDQYKFDFIQMVSLILCRNTGTCRVTPLLETQQYKHKLQIQIQIHLKLCS